MDSKLEVRAVSAPWHRGVEFVVFCDGAVAEDIVFKKKTDSACVPQPTFTLNKDEAQTLIDDLWNAGIRPTEGTGSAGSLRATEKHLDDMRKITFNKLNIEQ
jgi:hypothetical protein